MKSTLSVTIPIYVEQQGDVYLARPLFFPEPSVRHKRAEQAVVNLTRELHRYLEDLGEMQRHDELARFTLCPEWDEERLNVPIALRRQTVNCRFLFITFKALGTRLAFTPAVPDLWFALESKSDLSARAAEVLTHHFRECEKKGGDAPEAATLHGRAWSAMVEVSFRAQQQLAKPEQNLLAWLTSEGGKMSGQRELWKVGRNLDALFPDELDRVLLRDREVEEMAAALDEKVRRPVLLVGPRGAGKTALIHEYVYRVAEGRPAGWQGSRGTWLLSPQRLIAGMCYVGQWEERVLKIAEEAREKRHLLYFDNFLGLYQAGKSRQSDLTIAAVLKPLIEKGQLRVITEMTPAELRVFREVDRGLADNFHILPVREMSEAETQRILIWSMQRLEMLHDCRFALETLPAILDLQRRSGREIAFPGKAASFLKHLAMKYRGEEITREVALEEFRARTGLAVSFVDTRIKFSRQAVVDTLREGVIGQEEPVEAIADVLSIARARLNDPGRPLASLLFLGPTGVGKTQCAKTLAAYLYGDAEKLIRIDLNEYVAPGSAARLIGTFQHPEGVLTAAVRNRPFSVVLFDEVEKADPEVFDMLLQVLGEGRLTDAMGRTADFTNCLIILTSNLGVREAGRTMGFHPDPGAEGRHYREAAEAFFRPEFFNRLDRIIPFHHLELAQIEEIARHLIRDVFAREGLVRRRCILQVDPAAMERVIRQGYHPQLGARALKRVIEAQLTFPTAAHLAAFPPETPMVIQLLPRGGEIAVEVQPIAGAELDETPALLLESMPSVELLTRMQAALDSVMAVAERWAPEGSISSADLRPEYFRYFQARHLTDRLADKIRHLQQAQAPRRAIQNRHHKANRVRRLLMQNVVSDRAGRRCWESLFAMTDLNAYLQELDGGTALQEGEPADLLLDTLRELAYLELLIRTNDRPGSDRALVLLRGLDSGDGARTKALAGLYRETFDREFECNVEALDCPNLAGEQQSAAALLVEGSAAFILAQAEAGTHLFTSAGQGMVPVQVMAYPLYAEEDAAKALAARVATLKAWRAQLLAGQATVVEDPFPLQPVVRVYDERSITLDLRSGLLVSGLPQAWALRDFLQARFIPALELPEADHAGV